MVRLGVERPENDEVTIQSPVLNDIVAEPRKVPAAGYDSNVSADDALRELHGFALFTRIIVARCGLFRFHGMLTASGLAALRPSVFCDQFPDCRNELRWNFH